MQNLHDDNHLDDLSRDAAEQFQPDHQLHSWDKLHPQLDKELPVKKEKKRRYLFILLFFLLTGGGLIFSAIWSNRNEAQNQVPAVKQTDKTTDKAVAPNSTSGNSSSGNSKSNNNNTNDKNSDNTQPNGNADNNSSSAPTRENGQNPTRGNKKKQALTTPPLVDNKVDNKPDVVKDVIEKGNADTQKNIDDVRKNVEDIQKDSLKTDATVTKADPVETKADTAVAKVDSAKTDEQKPADKTATAAKKTTRQSPSVSASRWEFGVVYSPDISTVKFTHSQKPGTNVGLMIGYNISRRFAVQAGALYTIKNYKSHGSDYHPPKGYWTDYVKLETVTADCEMWDIPINLRYNILPKKSSNVFATAGLSSYLMKKEDYDFFYYYAGAPVNRYRSINNKGKDWFSVLNLSIGYERQLSRNFSLQAEPFFKQPLKGVGFGEVKLNSTGVFLSLKYKPVSNKKK